MPLTICTLTEADLTVADEIAVAAYRAPRSRKAQLQLYLRLQPSIWLLALLDDTPVGLGGLLDYGPFAYLGMMSVLPAVQGRGIGRAIVEHLLAWCDARGCPTVLLDASEAGEPLYQRFGFVEENRTAQWLRSIPLSLPASPPSPISVHISAIQEADLPALVAFDAPYFGAPRAMVLSSLFARYAVRAFVARDNTGQISGYLFAQKGSIGPWVARTVEDAEPLLVQALSLSFVGDGPSVNISAANLEGSALLERYGFVRLRALSYMRRGQPVERALTNVYGQASFALG